jgi:hypothetical protein
VGFAKLVFGVLLVGLGVVLLAGHFGFFPAGTGGWLLRYWPIVLIALGLALLANAIKNALLGWVATLLMIGALAFGAWWAYHHSTVSKSGFTKLYDLARPRAETLTLRSDLFGGLLVVGSGGSAPDTPAEATRRGTRARTPARGTRTLQVNVIGTADDAGSGPRFASSGGAAILDWPPERRAVYRAPLGAGIRVRAPDLLRVRLDAKSLFSDIRADLSRLRPERLDLNLMASRAAIVATGTARPSLVRIQGMMSTVDIRIPRAAPVRLEFHAPLTFRSLPEDFVENVGGRSKVKVWTSDGNGPVINIKVEGPLVHLRIRREPLSAL